MSLDLYAIGTALAGRYDNLTPPTGEPAIAYSGLPQNNLSSFPAVVVFPPEWDFAYQSGAREGEMTWTVRFYKGRMSGDVNIDTTALLKWASVLIDATHGAIGLGISGGKVRKAIPTNGVVGVHTYGGVEYGVVELEIGVWTNDAVTLTP